MVNIKERAKGLTSFGLYINILDPAIVEMAVLAGFDFIRIDCEHMIFDNSTLVHMIRTANLLDMPVQLRVSSLNDVSSLLDFGVSGIMVPHVDSRERAIEAVNAVKYGTLGRRGMFGNARYLKYGDMKLSNCIEAVNDEICLIVQIEDKEGLENIDDILSVDGVDMVATGKNDLSQSLGIPGQPGHPDVISAENFVIQKALEHNKIPTLLANTPERMKELKDKGVLCFVTGRDTVLLYNSLKNNISQYIKL